MDIVNSSKLANAINIQVAKLRLQVVWKSYTPYAARGYHVKLQRQEYNTERRTIIIIWKIVIEHTSVGLAHARPKYNSRLKDWNLSMCMS